MKIASVLFGLSAFVLFGCAVEADPESTGSTRQEVAPPRVCPAISILCAPGYTAKQLPNCRQICVPENDPATGAGEPCGDIVCPAGDVCCNDSCGICTPPDGVCIQLVCG